MFLTKRDQLYLNVNCELGTITHKLLWQMFSSSSHSQQLSSAAAGLGTEFLWLLSRKLYSGLITVITVIPPIIAPRGHTHYDLYSYHQGAAELLPLLGHSSCWSWPVVSSDPAIVRTVCRTWRGGADHVTRGHRHPLNTADTAASASTRRITWPNNVKTRYLT